MRYPGSAGDIGARWTSERPLTDDKGNQKECRTDFEVLEELDRCALVRCRIYTGRYHQIRRHANHCGRHIIGDTTHGKGRINALFRERFGLDRLFLHLARVELAHPSSGASLVIEDPLPHPLVEVLERLRRANAKP